VATEWENFISHAPAHWRKDTFETHAWVGIATAFGQNQPIANTAEGIEADAQVWLESQEYRNEVKYLNFATATHFEYNSIFGSHIWFKLIVTQIPPSCSLEKSFKSNSAKLWTTV
jgi:hypothetical protein